MNRAPKVSVIIPTYNRASLVCEAIKSVLDQTFDDYEIWVVDDGSTDDTREAVQSFLGPKVHYVYQANSGLARARNTGIEKSRGEYVALLDSDDRCLPERLLDQSRLLDDRQNVDVVFSDLWKVYPDGRRHRFSERVPAMQPVLARCPDNGCCVLPAKAMFPIILKDLPLKPSTLMLRRGRLGHVGLFDDRLIKSELDLLIRLIQTGTNFGYIHKPLVDLRMWEGNIHVRQPRERYEATIGILMRVRDSGRLDRLEDKCARQGIALMYSRLAVYYHDNGLRKLSCTSFLRAFQYSKNPWFLGHFFAVLMPRLVHPIAVGLRKSRIGATLAGSLNPHRIASAIPSHRSSIKQRFLRVVGR